MVEQRALWPAMWEPRPLTLGGKQVARRRPRGRIPCRILLALRHRHDAPPWPKDSLDCGQRARSLSTRCANICTNCKPGLCLLHYTLVYFNQHLLASTLGEHIQIVAGQMSSDVVLLAWIPMVMILAPKG